MSDSRFMKMSESMSRLGGHGDRNHLLQSANVSHFLKFMIQFYNAIHLILLTFIIHFFRVHVDSTELKKKSNI